MDMDIRIYLAGFAKELEGLSWDPEARTEILRYAAERLRQVLDKVEKELNDASDDSGT